MWFPAFEFSKLCAGVYGLEDHLAPFSHPKLTLPGDSLHIYIYIVSAPAYPPLWPPTFPILDYRILS